MSLLSSHLAKLDRLKRLQISAIELDIEIRADLLKAHLKNEEKPKSKLRFNTSNGLSVRSAIVQILSESGQTMPVTEIASRVCQLLSDRNPKKVVGQVSVALSSYCGTLFDKVSRGNYRLISNESVPLQ